MRWTTLIDTSNNHKTEPLAASVDHTITKSRGRLSLYILDWSYLLDSDKCMVMRLNVAIFNSSLSDQVVNQVLLTAREDKNLTLTPKKLRAAWKGNARVRLDDRRVYDICRNDEILILPFTIGNGSTVKGWTTFVIDSSQVEMFRFYKWCLLVLDQSGRQYKSKVEQDQSIALEVTHLCYL